MRRHFRGFAFALLLAGACNRHEPSTPFPRRSPVAPSPPSPSPAPRQAPPFAEPFRQISPGEVVRGVVSRDDPPCTDWPLWPCQYFRITIPADGRLDIVKINTPGNLDLSFNARDGTEWWDPVSTAVTSGDTYQITIWEYEPPGVTFQFRASFEPR